MARLRFWPATRRDAEYIAGNLRDSDWIELSYSSGDPAGATVYSAMTSEMCWVGVTPKDVPVCIFGVAELSSDIGSPWMVGTPELMQYRRDMLTEGKRYSRLMNKMYPFLTNYVYYHNVDTIRWLKACGYTIGSLEPHYGVGQQPFFHFYRSAADV